VTTFNEMIDDTLLHLQGYTTQQDQVTHLTSSVTADDTSMVISDVSAISRGIAEIGNELVWIDTVDQSTGTLTIPPYGRGYRSSTAAIHASGSMVTSSPMFPRKMVAQAINDTVKAVYPDLFAVGSTEIDFSPAVTTYSMPSGALDVLQVSWKTTGPSKEWLPVRRFRVDKHASTDVYATGVSVSVYDSVVPGRPMKFVFTKEPTPLVNDSDVFTTVTGLPASTQDLVRFGAAYRLVPFFDSAQLSGQSAQADFSATQRPAGSSSALSRFLLQMYQVRLAEEIKSLQSSFPIRSYYTR